MPWLITLFQTVHIQSMNQFGIQILEMVLYSCCILCNLFFVCCVVLIQFFYIP